jgi:predicted glutamine amidotransferase
MSKDLQIIKQLQTALQTTLEEVPYKEDQCCQDLLEDSCYYSIKNGRVVALNLRETLADNQIIADLVYKLDALQELNLNMTCVNKIACLASNDYLTVSIDYEDLDPEDAFYLMQDRSECGMQLANINLDHDEEDEYIY